MGGIRIDGNRGARRQSAPFGVQKRFEFGRKPRYWRPMLWRTEQPRWHSSGFIAPCLPTKATEPPSGTALAA